MSGSLEAPIQGYWVYVLVSDSTGRRYTGQTDDLDRRIAEHNSIDHKPRKYTSRNAGPWRLVYSEHHDTRAQAIRRERFLKSGAGREWLNLTIGRASPPEAD